MIDRVRLIILRSAFEKHLRKRMEKASTSAARRGPEFEQLSQDLADILDFLRDMEDNRGFWDATR